MIVVVSCALKSTWTADLLSLNAQEAAKPVATGHPSIWRFFRSLRFTIFFRTTIERTMADGSEGLSVLQVSLAQG